MRLTLPLALLLTVAGDLAGQVVTGFASVPWGSEMPAINLEWGNPKQVLQKSGASISIYHVTVEGEQVLMTFVVSDRYGLVKGGYTRPYDKKSEAKRALEKFERALQEKYPSLPQYRCSEGEEPCARMLSEEFQEAVIWEDLGNAIIYCIRHEIEFKGNKYPEMVCHFESELWSLHRDDQEERHF